MERLDFRIPDFQSPAALLQNISDLQSNTEYTNHIHRSIDQLRSLTDRATLNITLAATQDTTRDHRLIIDQRISPEHQRLLNENPRISPELEERHHDNRYLNQMGYQQPQRDTGFRRNPEVLPEYNPTGGHHTIDYSGVIKSEFNQQSSVPNNPENARYDANHDYQLNRCANNSEDYRQNNRNNYTSPNQPQHGAALINNNKNCGGGATITDGQSYSNSSPSSPGTPISIEGGNNFNPEDDKVFGSKADLQLHTQMHMREAKPYKCSQCCKAFANSSYLSQHTRIHLGIKPYRCEICQRKFTQLSHLQQHIRTHTGDKPYKCRHPGCQKAFSQLSNLQSHSRCHQTDKPYKCNSCYKCFSDEPSLLEHIPKHKESKHLKTHICQYCGKSYTQETYLQKHMQKHSERVDKRPPITGAGGPLTGLNRNLLAAVSAAGVASLESPYWSKLSPDTMSSLDLERLEYHNHHNSSLAASNAAALLLERNSSTNLGLLERSANTNVQNLHLEHRNSNYPTRNQGAENQTFSQNSTRPNDAENIPENTANRTTTNTANSGFDVQNPLNKANPDRNTSNPGSQHNNHDNIGEDLVVSNRHCRVNSPTNENSNIGANGGNGGTNGPNNGNGYDTNKSGYEISISRSVTNSAFTPISGINHLNLNHPIGRPYLYDALSFQNKELNLNLNKSAGNSNALQNQFISLHQIRNYAHQPSSIGSGDHILGLKDK